MDRTELELAAITVGPLQQRCYILTDAVSCACIIVDPGAEPERIEAGIGGQRRATILLTHGHTPRQSSFLLGERRAQIQEFVERKHPADFLGNAARVAKTT